MALCFARTQERVSGGKETYLRRKRCSRASFAAARRPSFYASTCCLLSPFLLGLVLPLEDDVNEARRFEKLFPSLGFPPTLVVRQNYSHARFFVRDFVTSGARVSVLVVHRVTEIYASSFACALNAIEKKFGCMCDAFASQQRLCVVWGLL